MTRYFGVTVAGAVLLVGALAGCGQSGGVNDDPPKGSNAGADDASPSASEKAAPTPKFGDAYTWEDGLTVKISKPLPYKPSEFAAVGKHPAYVQFEVTIINKTGQPFDQSLFSTSMQSNDQEAEEAFDSDKGMNGSPSTRLLDGRQSKFKVGYGVANPGDLVLDVTPSFDHEAMIWTHTS